MMNSDQQWFMLLTCLGVRSLTASQSNLQSFQGSRLGGYALPTRYFSTVKPPDYVSCLRFLKISLTILFLKRRPNQCPFFKFSQFQYYTDNKKHGSFQESTMNSFPLKKCTMTGNLQRSKPRYVFWYFYRRLRGCLQSFHQVAAQKM